ncbi:sciellin [Tenrec ecaudatus]|uniref:sciellin n=1 Tax=Tenrec ecaudatus TaxID=94439 RepID=UPI003F5AB7D9
MKSATQGALLKQQGFQDVNKRRPLLQDNSWIKKLPEGEKDENYGRAALNRHNSQDALDRKTSESLEPKARMSRYKSDETLDRISDRKDAAETHKANTLDNRLNSRYQKPGDLFNTSTTKTTASASASIPVKKKRQSWFPPPPPGFNVTASPGTRRRESDIHPPIPPKPTLPASSPHLRRQDNRSLDLDHIVRVARSSQRTNKGEEFDNLIKMNKSLNRNQGLDGLFRTSSKAEKEKRAKSMENLIYVNSCRDKYGKGKQDFDGLIKLVPKATENIKRGQSVDNLTKGTLEVNRRNKGGQSLDKLIKEVPRASGTDQGNQDLDKLIKVNPETLRNNQRNQDLDSFIKVNPASIRSNQSDELDNLIKVKPSAIRNNKRDEDLEILIKGNSNMSQNKNGSSHIGASPAGLKDTTVYTRTYVENSKTPKVVNAENNSGKYIQTVYSTSDRSVIERDMCTFCRKPLGTETKMILDELQICCHSTCFKCEICKQPLENLKAGDSIWIYRQTIHCEPCYSQVMGTC